MEGRIIVSEKQVREAIREWLHKKIMLNGDTRIADITHGTSYSLEARVDITDEPEEVKQPEQAA